MFTFVPFVTVMDQPGSLRLFDTGTNHRLTGLGQYYRKALIKAPLKNNYDPQRHLVRSEKNYFEPLGVPCLERCLWIRVQRDLSNRTYNGQATTGRGEDVGCGLGLKYALIVAAVVSEVEIIQQQSMN